MPFGTAAGDTTLARSDDDPSPSISLLGIGPAGSSVPLPFFGGNYTNLYVNNNGNVTFNAAFTSFAPTGFPNSPSTPMIAPFWADVDTRGGAVTDPSIAKGTGTPLDGPTTWNNSVFYRTAQDAATLNSIDQTIHASNSAFPAFTATAAEVVTWDHVGYYNEHIDKANTFQVVIATDGVQTYAMFEYPTFTYSTNPTSRGGITWTMGDQSAGAYPSVGFDAGDGTHYFNLPGSRTAQVLNLPSMSDTIPATPGLFVFKIDSNTIGGSGGSASALTWNGGAGTWSQGGSNWKGAATVWGNADAATFTNAASATTVTLGGPVVAQGLTFVTTNGAQDTGYTFTASTAANSLQINSLTLPDATSTVTFGGSLVVLTNQTTPDSSSVISQGNLDFTGSSVLVARGVGAITGGTLNLQDNAQIQLYSAGATTTGVNLSFGVTTSGTGGTLDLRGYNTAFGTISSLTTGAGVITNSGTAAAALTTGFNTVSSAYSGLVKDGTGTLALTKSGSGTLALSGANTYSGGTTLSGGTLLVNNTTGSATGSGPVSVNGSGTVLGGNGTITGPITVTAGAINPSNNVGAPGASSVVGTLHVGALTLSSLAGAVFDLNSATIYDKVAASGNVSLGGSALTVNLNPNAPLQTGQMFDLIHMSGGTLSGTFANLPVGSSFTAGNEVFSVLYTPTDFEILATVTVPEPSTWAGGALLLATAASTLHRRSRARPVA